jgi:hypothetical protein
MWLHTDEKQILAGCGGGQAEQALPLKSISGVFFEAAVLGSIPKISTRMTSILSSPTSMFDSAAGSIMPGKRGKRPRAQRHYFLEQNPHLPRQVNP